MSLPRTAGPALLFWFVLLTGCTSLKVVRVGERLPPSPADCPVRFERWTPEQAAAAGEREVGSGCAAGYASRVTGPMPDGNGNIDQHSRTLLSNDFTDELKADVRPNVCALGGDLVIITGLCTTVPDGSDAPMEGLTLMIFAKQGGGSPPPPAPGATAPRAAAAAE